VIMTHKSPFIIKEKVAEAKKWRLIVLM
jgi:hypothetical protein